MSDISINVPLLPALAVVSAIYWPITLGLVGVAIAGTVRFSGSVRFVCAAIALALVAGWAVGLRLLGE
jgi:uncharacterized membrane protein